MMNPSFEEPESTDEEWEQTDEPVNLDDPEHVA